MDMNMVLNCPNCPQKLRCPTGRGALTLTCKTCGYRWDWEPPMGRDKTGWVVTAATAAIAVAIGAAIYFMCSAIYFMSGPRQPAPESAKGSRRSRPAVPAIPEVPISAEKKVEHRFAKVLPNSRAAVSTWFDQKGLRVLPQSYGEEEGELKKVGPLVATKVTGDKPVSWQSRRFAGDSNGVSLKHLTGIADADMVKGRVVTFDKGIIRVNAAAFPADGKWHLFCLATEDLLGTSEDEREVFCLLKPTTKVSASDPADLVVKGCVAEGWDGALSANWSDDQLRCLVFMVCGQTELLAQEAHVAIRYQLRDRHHAFLLRDLVASAAVLDARKQALLQRIPSSP